MNYEGSQARIIENTEDEQYYNLTSERGWWVSSIVTDLDHGQVPEFINKENKWFNRISGVPTYQFNLDEDEFTVQGIGSPSFAFTQEQILENEPFIFEVGELSPFMTSIAIFIKVFSYFLCCKYSTFLGCRYFSVNNHF